MNSIKEISHSASANLNLYSSEEKNKQTKNKSIAYASVCWHACLCQPLLNLATHE